MSGAALEILGRVSLSAGVMILAAAALRLRFGGRTPGRVFCLLWDIILLRLLLGGKPHEHEEDERHQQECVKRTFVHCIFLCLWVL